MRERNIVIDVLRVLFALIIVAYHIPYGPSASVPLFPRGYLACEFFFMVSGYYTAKKVASYNENNVGTEHLGQETFEHIIRKIKRVFPLAVLSYIPAFVCSAFYATTLNPQYTMYNALQNLLDAIYELTFVTMCGICGFVANGVSWFFSALFLSTAIVYPVLRKHYDRFVYLIAPLGSIFILEYCSQVYGSLNLWRHDFNGFIYPGMLRALVETSLGSVSYEISRKIGGKVPWGIPLFLYLSAMVFMARFSSFVSDFLVLILLFAAVSAMSALEKNFSFHSKFPLEKFSIALVLNHIYIYYLLECIYISHKFLVYMGSVIVTSIGMTMLDRFLFGIRKRRIES